MEQRLLRVARPDTVLYTNLGQGGPIDETLAAAGRAEIVTTGGVTFLRVPEAVWERLRIPELWDRTADPPRFYWV